MNIKYIISLSMLVALTGASCWGAASNSSIGLLARLYAEGPADLAPAILASLHRKDLLQLAAMGCKEKNLVLRGEKESERFPNLYQDAMRELFNQKEKFRQFLRQHNRDVNAALVDAAKKNKPLAIDYLIQNGADLNARYNYNWTALMYAADNGHVAVVALLIAAKANLDVRNKYGNTALMLAAMRDNRGAVIAQLVAADADVNAKNNYGTTALMMAAIDNRGAVVTQLIAARADVDAKKDFDITALMRAAEHGHEAVAAQLIAADADVNARDDNGNTALSLAENTVINGYYSQAERDGARAVVDLLTRGR